LDKRHPARFSAPRFSAAGNPRNNDAALEPVRELDETAPATDLQISWSESQANRISKINVRYAA
jgi:hypothetical protein